MIGDQLLVSVARRLETCIRPHDSVARFGGDEFAVLLNDIKDIGDATHVADRIQSELSMPFSLAGQEVFTTASIVPRPGAGRGMRYLILKNIKKHY